MFDVPADSGDQPLSTIDTTVPHSARVWNYWLGGKDNFAPDRAVGDQVRDIYPEIVEIARASRAFLVRAVGTTSTPMSATRTPSFGSQRGRWTSRGPWPS